MRLGILGGTFDPIHHGHLRMAQEAYEQLELEQVVFIPNNVSPFKTGQTITDSVHRLAMLRRAIVGNAAFSIWDSELKRGGISYTVDTLEAITAENPDFDIHFLTGSDSLRDITRWRRPDRLFEIAKIAVLVRPGVAADEALDELKAEWRNRVDFVTMPALDISATDIRRRISMGRSAAYLTPDSVIDYIKEYNLYTDLSNIASVSTAIGVNA